MARVQIEQLRAGRERLIEAYRVVRRTLDEATDELSVVETEARVAADSAARRAASAPEGSVDELEADLTTARRADLPLVEPSSTFMPRPEPESEVAEAEAPPPPPPPAAPPPPPPPPAPVVEGSIEPEPVEPEQEASEPPDALEPVVRVLQAFDVDAVAAELERQDPPAEEVPEPASEADVAAEPDAGPETAATSVEDLFARIKADRADAVARARAVLEEVPDIEADPELASPNGSMAPSDIDESMLQRRDEMLDPIEEQLGRKLKRAMQDEQNELLDAMRVARGPLSDLVPDAEPHDRRYADAATPLLVEALRAGAAFANPSAPCPDGLDDEVTSVTDALVADLAVPLRARIHDALSEAADESDTQVAVDRLGAAFRQWKIERIGALVRHHAAAAFSRGAYLAAGDEQLRWVVDDDGAPCPDCDDNALAGPTPRGEEFPTGQHHPPAHPGCRCLLVPA